MVRSSTSPPGASALPVTTAVAGRAVGAATPSFVAALAASAAATSASISTEAEAADSVAPTGS
ncbi:hypothetical protein HK405_002383, partial [Cladochytrium tenue]